MSKGMVVPYSQTFGEVYPTFMVELVMPAGSVDPSLLLWDGRHAYIERRLHMTPGLNSQFNARLYVPPDVNPTIWNAIRLPTHAGEYGSTRELFSDFCQLFNRFVGMNESAVRMAVHAVLASWFSERPTFSICVSIAGARHTAALQLFQLLSCLYRRALVLNASSLPSFPPIPNQLRFCPFFEGSRLHSSTDFADLIEDGQLVSLSRSAQDMWDEGAFGSRFRGERINLALAAVTEPLPGLDRGVQEQIAAEFQPKLLMYRFRNYQEIVASPFSPAPLVGYGLAGCLANCVCGDSELQKELRSFLSDRVETNPPTKRPLKEVIVEALLRGCHEQLQRETLSVAALATRVNATLKRCGDGRSLSPHERSTRN